MPTRLQRLDRLHHAVVGRRAAIGGAAVVPADEIGALARLPRHLPLLRPAEPLRRLGTPLDAGADLAAARAQIGAEPRHHQRHALQVRAAGEKLVERGGEIAGMRRHMPVLRLVDARPVDAADGARIVAELGGAGDQRHRAQLALQRPHRALQLHRDLRQPVAEGAERQALEHHIGEAAIGRRLGLPRLDQRVGQLALAAIVEAHVQPAGVEQPPVGPDTPEPRHRPLAQADREAAEIGIGGGGRRRAAHQVAAPPCPPALCVCVETTSSTGAAQITWPESRARP